MDQKDEERYLVQALEFESVLRACLYRYARNASDVEELLQETYARLLTAGPPTSRKFAPCARSRSRSRETWLSTGCGTSRWCRSSS